MRAFVTGATGFLGYNLVLKLLKKGWDVKCLVRNPEKAKILPEKVEKVWGDITDLSSLDMKAFEGVDVVFHIAGLISSPFPELYTKVNFEGTRNLVLRLIENGAKIKKFIFTSSLAACGPSQDGPIKENDIPHPVEEYGRSKYLAEEFLKSVKNLLNVVIVRPTAIYGQYDKSLLPLFQIAFKLGMPVLKGHTVSLVHVDDVVDLLIFLAENEKVESGEVFNISDGKNYSFDEVWEVVDSISMSLVGRHVRKIHVPHELVVMLSETYLALFRATFWFLAPLLKLKNGKIPQIPSPEDIKRIAQKNWSCSIEKVQKLGFSPKFGIKEGFRQTLLWYLEKSYIPI